MIVNERQTDPQYITDILGQFRGGVAYDVGANCGQAAMVLAPNFERVISFEPHPESRAVAAAEVPISVEVLEYAVSSHDGPIQLDVQLLHANRGQFTTRLVPEQDNWHGWGPFQGTHTVQAVQIDTFVKTCGPVPDFIKIDVEGHELEVVRGAMATLADHRPALFIEIHLDELGKSIGDLLRVAGYDQVSVFRHPAYSEGEWGWDNHWWMTVKP